jgi:AcrR family transcriptional regulator
MAKDSKEHILEVSLLLFLKKSYEAVTMKELVEKTGLSKGAFYHYFESKDQLFIEVFKHYYIDIIQEEFSNLPQNSLKDFYTSSLKQNLKVFRKFSKLSDKRTIGKINHFLMLFEAINRNPKFREIARKESEREINSWEKVIKNAKSTGEIKTALSAQKIAKMFIYMGDGHGMHNIFDKETGNFDPRETMKLYDSLYELLKA